MLNPDVVDVCTNYRNRKHTKSNNLLKTKRILNIKMSTKRGPVFTFSLPGVRLAHLTAVSYVTGYSNIKEKK